MILANSNVSKKQAIFEILVGDQVSLRVILMRGVEIVYEPCWCDG
jgi:hypothetical protein